MKFVKNTLFLFALFFLGASIFSCKDNIESRHLFQLYYENNETNYFSDGSPRKIMFWNEKGKDESFIEFDSNGDTLGIYILNIDVDAVAFYTKDSIEYRFRVINEETGSRWSQEFFKVSRSSGHISTHSSYFFANEFGDSIIFEHYGYSLDYLAAIPYYIVNDELISGDTLFSNNNRNIKAINLTNKKMHLVGYEIIRVLIPNEPEDMIYFSLKSAIPIEFKLHVQKLFNLNRYFVK